MTRSGRKPDREPTLSDCKKSPVKVADDPFALEFVDLEGRAHMEAVHGQNPIGEDLPLRNAAIGE
jgi:hypothetical protein